MPARINDAGVVCNGPIALPGGVLTRALRPRPPVDHTHVAGYGSPDIEKDRGEVREHFAFLLLRMAVAVPRGNRRFPWIDPP